MTTKVAAIQMCSSHDVDENLQVAAALIHESAKNGAKLIVLPEMFAILGCEATDKVQVQEPFGAGKIQHFLSQQAKSNHIWIVGGTIPIQSDDKNKICAACLVFNSNGECVARYDKMHLFDVQLSADEAYKESDTTQAGDQIVTVDTPFGKLGLAVCYDVRFPELFRALFDQGVEIFTLPSAFTVTTGKAHWEVLARCRAIENFSYLIGACQGGKHANGRETYGDSIIVEPWGTIVARKDDASPGIIYAEIDLQKVYDARAKIPVGGHRRKAFPST